MMASDNTCRSRKLSPVAIKSNATMIHLRFLIFNIVAFLN